MVECISLVYFESKIEVSNSNKNHRTKLTLDWLTKKKAGICHIIIDDHYKYVSWVLGISSLVFQMSALHSVLRPVYVIPTMAFFLGLFTYSIVCFCFSPIYLRKLFAKLWFLRWSPHMIPNVRNYPLFHHKHAAGQLLVYLYDTSRCSPACMWWKND